MVCVSKEEKAAWCEYALDLDMRRIASVSVNCGEWRILLKQNFNTHIRFDVVVAEIIWRAFACLRSIFC